MATTVLVERCEQAAVVLLNRPQVKNALDMDMRRALRAALDELAVDATIRAVVITGAGNAFCAGGDFKAVASSATPGRPMTTLSLAHDVQPLLECIARMDKPVIAAVNGPAVGFGMSLALACDLMIMAPEAYLLSQFIKLGLIPDGGAAWFLVRRIGYARMFEVITGTQKLTSELCLTLGIANRLASDGDVRTPALLWAQELAAAAPLAMAYTKRLARLAVSNRLEETLLLEAEFQGICAASADSREAIAALREGRQAKFTGR
jgi:2-(1,2-epoxy-1,2-dihydrophenyl)acetyl-CoA isomerase